MIGKSSASGGKRIGVVFYRVILPSGASFMLPDQQAIDGVGFPGLLDRYDEVQRIVPALCRRFWLPVFKA